MNYSYFYYFLITIIYTSNIHALRLSTSNQLKISKTKISVVGTQRLMIGTSTRLCFSNMNNTEKEPSRVEPKYLAALGVFIFAALYDFFITHHGQVYLAHPQ